MNLFVQCVLVIKRILIQPLVDSPLCFRTAWRCIRSVALSTFLDVRLVVRWGVCRIDTGVTLSGIRCLDGVTAVLRSHVNVAFRVTRGHERRVATVGEMRNQGALRPAYVTRFCVTGSIH